MTIKPPPLPPAPCRKCGYQMEGLTIDAGGPEGGPDGRAGVAQWRAVCPECGQDNFGPVKPERQVRWILWMVRGVAFVGVVGALALAWVVARAMRPFFP